jgi:hypothetical protein
MLFDLLKLHILCPCLLLLYPLGFCAWSSLSLLCEGNPCTYYLLCIPNIGLVVFPFPKGVLSLGLIFSRLILLIFIRDSFVEGRFESFPSLIRFIFLLILPILVQIFSSLSFLIQVFSLPDGLCQSGGFIILYIFFIKGWKST